MCGLRERGFSGFVVCVTLLSATHLRGVRSMINERGTGREVKSDTEHKRCYAGIFPEGLGNPRKQILGSQCYGRVSKHVFAECSAKPDSCKNYFDQRV